MDLITYGLLNKAKANLDSPAFTGTPTAPTPATTDNTTKLATTEFVRSFVATLKGFYLGVTTTTLVDEVTTNPDVVINGETVTAQDGNWVIVDGGEEFVYSGTVWQKFGDSNWISVVGDTYNSSLIYNTGDYVIYMDGFYKCKENNVTGTWDSTKWDSTTLADEILANKVSVNLNSAPTDTLKNIKIGNTVYGTTVTKLLSDSEYNSLTPEQKKDGTIYLVNTSGPKIVSFTTGTDEQIKAMLDAYYADKLTWAEMGWNIGDTRVIHLDAMQAPTPNSDQTWAAQDITVVIVAHDHTDLAEPINEHTKACITVQTREVMNNNTSSYNNQAGHIHINGDSSYDMTFTKWSDLYMRTYMNSVVFNAFDSSFKSMIKPSSHYRHTTYNGTASEQVTDNLFLPSYPEIFGTSSYSYYVATNPVEGTQFSYYTTSSNRSKYGNNNGSSNGASQYWFEGSASSYFRSNSGYYWCYIDTTGSASDINGSFACGLAPAFVM